MFGLAWLVGLGLVVDFLVDCGSDIPIDTLRINNDGFFISGLFLAVAEEEMRGAVMGAGIGQTGDSWCVQQGLVVCSCDGSPACMFGASRVLE